MKEKKKVRNPLSRTIIIGGVVFAIVFGLAVAGISYKIFEKRMMNLYTKHITSIMNLTLANIDVDDLAECIATQEPTDKFKELIAYVDQARINYDLSTITIVYPEKVNGRVEIMQVLSGLYPEERYGDSRKDIPLPLLGDYITDFLPPGFPDQIYDEFINRYDIKYSKEKNAFGNDYYAAYTIRNSDGTPVAILTTSASLDEIDATMRDFMTVTGISILALSAIFVILTVEWLKRRVIKPLKQIGTVADDFERKSRDSKDPDALIMENKSLHKGDELEALANTLAAMSLHVKSYVEELLKSALEMESMRDEVTRANNLAMRDSLTGVKSKAAYDQQRGRLNLDIQGGDAEFAIAMIDINYLKRINDNYGHEKGNIYIKKMCTMICDVFNHSPVFRVGGDEFVVVLIHRDYDNREELIKELKQKMNVLADRTELEEWLRPSAAIGVAVYDENKDTDCDQVFKRADDAMYENKTEMKACRKV
ncbi:MAG: diguanylate cyclase [Lachnospiraceae bacterium]|nr:diguanylate cyclase [Lachnospiraceae bacterium]